jgi:hypothetical protein
VIVDRVAHVIESKRLGDDACDLALQLLFRAVELADEARHQDDPQSRRSLQPLLDQLDAVQPGHLQVGDQQVDASTTPLQTLERLGAVLSDNHLVAVQGQGALHQIAGCRIVVGEKNARHKGLAAVATSLRPTLAAASAWRRKG